MFVDVPKRSIKEVVTAQHRIINSVKFILVLFLFLNRKYADSINEKLTKSLIGLHTQIKYQSDEPNSTSGDPTNAAIGNLSNNNNEYVFNIRQLLEDGLKKNLLYLILVSQTNEQFNSARLFVLNKWKSTNDIEQAAKTSQINIKGKFFLKYFY
jgi:hypothetical protein